MKRADLKILETKYVDPTTIDNTSFRCRRNLHYDGETFEVLKNSIEFLSRNIVPVKVMKKGLDLITIDGHRRIVACMDLGLPVYAEIIEEISKVDAITLFVILNRGYDKGEN